MGNTVTSWKIDEAIYKKFRIRCIEKDVGISEAVEQAMEMWMKK